MNVLSERFIQERYNSVIENINVRLFNLIKATSESSIWYISFAKFIARYLIGIVPVLLIFLCLYVSHRQSLFQRRLIIKIIIALMISLFFSWILGKIFPHDRPFINKMHSPDNLNYLHHAADNSFPSDHGSIIFTFSLSFLFWHRLWSGIALLNVSAAIVWSRLYLGVHWPLDMVGSLVVGFISCLSAQIIWFFYRLISSYHGFKKVHRFTYKDNM